MKPQLLQQQLLVHFLIVYNLTALDQDAIAAEKTRLASESNQDVIKAIKVQKIYPNGFKALYDLSFGVEKGQIFCILGPNGAGKTTTFNVITGKIPINTGKIYIKNQDPSQAHQTTGICLETDTLWNSLTIKQHLEVYAGIRGLKKPETKLAVGYLLEALGLEEYGEKRIIELSGGTKRKVCVALSIIGAPDTILLDEPTTGVDPKGRSQIWNLLKSIVKKKEATLIMSTHYMEDVELVADKLGNG